MISSGAVSEAVARVEYELNAFWSSPEGGPDKVRASTMNFAVATAPGEIDRLRGETASLAQTRGGRVFLVAVEGRVAPWEVASEVSAVCSKESGEVVCHDRIELTFGAMSAGRAGSVVGALALSEVPTIFEVGRGAPAPLVDALVKPADRVIVDSAHTPLSRIEELMRKTRAPFADRAMVRMFSWRDLVARFFDDEPASLAAIRAVAIRRSPGSDASAALLVGWLASRLGWKLEGRAQFRGPGGVAIRVAVAEDPRKDVPPGELTSVRIEAEGGDEYLCERMADPHTVCWKRTGARPGAHDYPLGFHDETWVLLKAIDATASDRIYRELVPLAAAWSTAS